MQRKMFWLIFVFWGLLGEFYIAAGMGISATLPILVLSWWITRSG